MAPEGVGGSSCGPGHPNPTATTIGAPDEPVNAPPRALPGSVRARKNMTFAVFSLGRSIAAAISLYGIRQYARKQKVSR